MGSKNNPTSKYSRIRVGLTIGDPSGIGPAIAVKAIARLKGRARFVLIGDKRVILKAGGAALRPQDADVVDLANVNFKDFAFGKVKAEYGKASIEYLDKAMGLVKEGSIDCIVTCPISKEAINLAGYRYSGHTEYFAKKTGSKEFVMLLLNNELVFSLLTRHMPIRDVSSRITRPEVARNITLTMSALSEFFLISRPRVVVCGLNPHASDNGLLGKEENAVIKPVVKYLKNKGFLVDGPVSADVAIYLTKEKKYDCAIAMYHDQALIPLKFDGIDTGVNLTYGLPFVRTSPLHGTAFDIAKRPGLCDPRSLIAAVRLAIKCTSNLKKD